MSTGRFGDAVSALRASAEAAPGDAQQTRGRILADLRRVRARRAMMLGLLVPIAAVFVGSTAWAAAAGYMPKSWRAVVTVLGFDQEIPTEPAQVPASAPPSTALGTLQSAAPVQGTPSPPPISGAVKPQGVPAAPAAFPPARRPGGLPASVPAPAAQPAQSTPDGASPAPAPANLEAPAAPDGDALYAEAHRLHFAERNPTAALSAWDAYLRAAPRGRFAVEAHYNRALCLVRLGRASQAKGALEPFASGAFGGYRQAEARALLDAMAASER